MAPSKPFNLDSLKDSITAIFDQTQLTAANHRKNCVSLYKLHVQASTIVEPAKNGAIKVVGERAFGDAFLDLLTRVMVIKKGTVAADRVVKFVGNYAKYMTDKSTEEQRKNEEVDEDEDTFSSRFINRLFKWLSSGFNAKDKIARYRTVQIISEIMTFMGELDEDTYKLLKENLILRVTDKESLIRAHAVIALSKLAGSEDPEELSVDDKSILDVMLEVIRYDDAPEVRRTALVNVPLTSSTLSIVLSRTRDTDTLTRKLVYSTALKTKIVHPKQLSIAQREQIVKDGLGDREPTVRLASAKLIASWLEVFMGEVTDDESWTGDDGGVMRGLACFLTAFDLFGPGVDVAVDALHSIFVTRPDVLESFVFNEQFWRNLSPESVLLARVFSDYCSSFDKTDVLDKSGFPVVTVIAFCLQEAYNKFLDSADAVEQLRLEEDKDEEEADQKEGEAIKCEVVLSELLRIASKLDYADEIGRRQMFSIIRDVLAQETLSDNLIERGLDVLYQLVPDERDLIRIVVEIVAELRDDPEEVQEEGVDVTLSTQQPDPSLRKPKSREDMSPEEAHRADLLDIRCLTLCIGMLERVQGTFEDNRTLEGVLGDLIIPAVRRTELAIREKGLIGLALCCLIAKKMALNSFQLFLNQVQSSPPKLRLKVLQTIFDLLMMYGQDEFKKTPDLLERVSGFLLETMKAEESNEVQAALCIGMCKLLLSGLIADTKVLTFLILLYISPDTADNHELRQCLSYFFPVYAYSSPKNQRWLCSVFIDAFDTMTSVYDDLEDEQEMISPHQFGLLMIEWTHPQKAVDAKITVLTDGDVHAILGISILAALYDTERAGEHQKVLVQLLSHLHIQPGVDKRSLAKLKLLVTHLEQKSPLEDSAAEKLFARFESRFMKTFAKDIEALDFAEYMDEHMHTLFELVGEDAPDPKGPQAMGVDQHEDSEVEEEGAVSKTEANGSRHESDRDEPASKPRPEPTSEDEVEGVIEGNTSEEDTPPSPPPPPPPKSKPDKKVKPKQTRRSTRQPKRVVTPPPDSEGDGSGRSDKEATEERENVSQATNGVVSAMSDPSDQKSSSRRKRMRSPAPVVQAPPGKRQRGRPVARRGRSRTSSGSRRKKEEDEEDEGDSE